MDAPGAPFAKRTGFLLSTVGWATTALFRRTLEPLGLKPPQWAVLNILDGSEGLSQQGLSDAIRIDASTMVALIDDLEARGLVERERDPADRRRYVVRLTDAGRRTLREARRAATRNEEYLLGPLDAAERETLHGLLLKLAAAGHLPRTPHPPISPASPETGPPRGSSAGR